MKILCYEKCSTCKKALKWLKENGIEIPVRPIKEENPSKEELRQWQKLSGLPLNKFFNTSGKLYREYGLSKKLPFMSDEEMLDLLASDGMLVKRPILVKEDAVLVGFKESEYAEELLPRI
ncbi:MAG: arsenate reductase family protein [Erysipelotrichaceae bacterium]|nr:arsenate reductase family protein [Erysipelotrichaceae bacterium]